MKKILNVMNLITAVVVVAVEMAVLLPIGMVIHPRRTLDLIKKMGWWLVHKGPAWASYVLSA